MKSKKKHLANFLQFNSQNGKREAEITGDDSDVQKAVQAIKERLSQQGGYQRDDSRSFNNNHKSSQNTRSNNEDDGWGNERSSKQGSGRCDKSNEPDDWDTAWDKPTPQQTKTNEFKPSQSSTADDWGDLSSTAYQPSANTYKSSSSDNRSRHYDGNRRGSFSSRGNFGGGFKSDFRSSYSSGAKEQSTTSNPSAEAYEPIDWDKANAVCEEARKARWEKCPKMIKKFYKEHPKVTNMSEEEVEKFRIDNKNIVISRTFSDEASTEQMPKPTTHFEYAFEAYPDLMAEIKKAGFEKPSPIQVAT